MIDLSYKIFLDYSGNCLLESQYAADSSEFDKCNRNRIASILFSWIAIELFVNNMMIDFISTGSDKFELHELAFMKEKNLNFESNGEYIGEFRISNNDSYKRLEDKIVFLTTKFSPSDKTNKSGDLWRRFKSFKSLRDSFTHPNKEKEIEVNEELTKQCLECSKDVIRDLAKKVWKKQIDI